MSVRSQNTNIIGTGISMQSIEHLLMGKWLKTLNGVGKTESTVVWIINTAFKRIQF